MFRLPQTRRRVPRLPPDWDLCADCGVHTSDIDEYYMVHNRLWEAATSSRPARMLCIGCVEARLGRVLTRADFTPAPVNWIMPKSERLMARLGMLDSWKGATDV